ncbi:MAG TPA: hypothetical protein VFP72_19405 [Kineosporiaceae bacterium]|nr:hypothetical protein [Kineosporiaceae bacterium]
MRYRAALGALVLGTVLVAAGCSSGSAPVTQAGSTTAGGSRTGTGTGTTPAAGGHASTSRTPGSTGSPGGSPSSGSGSVTPPAPTGTGGTPSAPGGPGAVPLKPGEQPPQFIVLSFDGAAWHELMTHWLDTAEQVHGQVTFFLSGIYLVPKDRAATLYHPPGHAAGASDIGFSTVPKIRTEIEDLRQAYDAGNEIGTHFNGHFCGSTGIDRWTADDWTSELNQFKGFLDGWQANTGITDVAALPFTSVEVRGARTPCLEGRVTPLSTAEQQAGFRYDASRTGQLRWPAKSGGLWEFPLPSIRLAGTGRSVLAMDYNFYYSQSHASPAPVTDRPAMQQQVLDSYRQAFQAVYQGNRAPLILGNHFNQWNGGIYTDALTDFYREACTRPQVRCVSMIELADWLDAQDPAALARLQALPPAQ